MLVVMAETTGTIQNNINTFAFFYRMVDIITIKASLLIALLFYNITYSQQYFVMFLVGTITYIIVAESLSVYRSWRSGYFKQIIFYTFISWAVAAVFILCYLFFTKSSEDSSRVAIAIWFVLSYSFLIGWRYAFSIFLEKVRLKGYNTRNIAIIGLTKNGQRLAQQILKHPETGYRLTAIYDDRSKDRIDEAYHQYLDGSVENGVEKAKNNEFDAIYVALPITAEKRIKKILFLLGDTTANVHLVPDLFIYSLMKASMSHVGEIQTISVYGNPMQGASVTLKRVEDILLSLSILTVIAIPMLVIAAIIKLTSRGPILFIQDRYGLGGKKIKVWKFRSMTVAENAGKVVQATKNDVRITPFGGFLRRTSLDELPQFFNALQGHMSVVGPRPHAVAHNEEYRKQVNYYMLRHKVKPGITGWAQVNGWRGETDTIDKMEMRIKFDLEYIRTWSLWLDFKIVLFTIFRSFNDKNAY
jgi:putative colanic acid biosynthesis UDP-glucose lipid carrier transferase